MFESLQKTWTETMAISEARIVVWATVILVLIVTGVYFAKLFRDFAFAARPSEADRINDMRNLKEIGALNDREYQRAREALAAGALAQTRRPQSESIPFKSLESSGQPEVEGADEAK